MSQSHGSTWRKAAEGRNARTGPGHKRTVRSSDAARKPQPAGSARGHGAKPVLRSPGKLDASTLMQELKPTVWIGKQGFSETVVHEITAQLKSRKAVKVKWLQNTEINPEDLARATGARLIGVRGRTLVLEERRRL